MRGDRRAFLKSLAAAALLIAWPLWRRSMAAEKSIIKKSIPSTGERLPVIGMGTWETFDVGDDASARAELLSVLQAFFDQDGAVIDSSPMYGSSEIVAGDLLRKVTKKRALFAATKVWTEGKQEGILQMRESAQRMGVKVFDLMQVHNLVDWETHLETLKEWKARKQVRYIGITTSHGLRHREMERVMAGEPIDFVQLSYSLVNREAERRLLPLAQERGIAVLANRPFQKGGMFDRVAGKPLPEWAAEIDCRTWAQFFLKFVVSHPAVTCAIPATSRVKHMRDNMGANTGRLPDRDMREKMVRAWNEIV